MKYLRSPLATILISLAVIIPTALLANPPCLDYEGFIHLVTSLDTGGHPEDVAVSGELIIVADGTGGLDIIDGSDPVNPVILSSLLQPYFGVSSLITDGVFVYAISDQLRKLFILDISDPSSPLLIGEAGTAVYPTGIAKYGKYVLLSIKHLGLEVFDISDPSLPVHVSFAVTQGLAYDIAISGDYAFLPTLATSGLLEVVDISDPAAPSLVAALVTPHAEDQPLCVTVWGQYIVMGGFFHLYTIDISDPVAPSLVGSVMIGSGYNVMVEGGIAYVVGQDLKTVRLDDPTEPIILGVVDLGDTGKGLALMGDHVLVAADDSGLQIIDATHASGTPLTSTIATPDDATAIACNDHLAVVADVTSVQLIDYTIPTGPEVVGWLETPGFAEGVAVNDTMAYVADMHYGLQVIDIRNPAHPQIVGSVNTPDLACDVAVQGDWAYVADQSWGVRVVNVSTPTNPLDMGYVDTAQWARAVSVHGNILLVADSADDLVVMDISSPDTPVVSATLDLVGMVSDVAVYGTVGVAIASYGLFVLDLSIPSEPRITDHVSISASAVVIEDSMIFATGRDMVVIDASDIDNLRIVGSAHLPYRSSDLSCAGDAILAAGGDVYMAWPHCTDPALVTISTLPVPVCPFGLAIFPNPFNPRTTVTFTIDEPQPISIDVLDLSGRRIENLSHRVFDAGDHAIIWSGRDASGCRLPSGSYILRLQSPLGVSTCKISLVR